MRTLQQVNQDIAKLADLEHERAQLVADEANRARLAEEARKREAGKSISDLIREINQAEAYQVTRFMQLYDLCEGASIELPDLGPLWLRGGHFRTPSTDRAFERARSVHRAKVAASVSRRISEVRSPELLIELG